MLYRFQGTDGAYPSSGLIRVSGTLYGTTERGGNKKICCGTVFALSLSGKERVVHHFDRVSLGYVPTSGVIDVHGKLYGTAFGGDENNDGVVYEVTLSGKERVLYRFKGFPNDGSGPAAGLVALNGMLYGATSAGGRTTQCSDNVPPPYGCGTIFKVDPITGAEKVLYVLKRRSSGSGPIGNLLALNGVLYGTASEGGPLRSYNNGTVFRVTTSGVETTLYAFKCCWSQRDGSVPAAGLVQLGGTLYGTTAYGGAKGNGTVFRLSP